MLNAGRVVGNVCRPTRTSGCDLHDSKGACCVDKKSAEKEGGRVCEPTTGVNAGDASNASCKSSCHGAGPSCGGGGGEAVYCGGRERHPGITYTYQNTLTGNRHP